MSIKGFYLLPHPPIVIPEVGRGHEEKIKDTSEGFKIIAKEIAEKAPKTIIIVSPHGVMFQEAISLYYEGSFKGNLSNFRVPQVSMDIPINKQLTSKIYELAYGEGLSAIMSTNSLLEKYNADISSDHGSMVPLYFINKYYKEYKLVHITYALLSDIELYRFGMAVSKAVEELKEEAVFIASGDLSHRLKEEGPYGYNAFGEKFDKEFLDNLVRGDVKGTLSIDKETICEAGECGRRSIGIMLGALEGKKFKGELLSYEGTFGVGYGIIRFNIIGEAASKLQELEELRKAEYQRKVKQGDPYVRLARESLTAYLSEGETIKKLPSYVTEEMKGSKRGVFVSLKKHGDLRGCIGTITPLRENIAEEIVRNAVEAGVHDPRFYEVNEEELMEIDFSVDVLTEPEPAAKEDLDPKKYGVIVRTNRKAGLLLPDLEGVNTIEEQLGIALDKAGIRENEKYTIEKFMVIRHRE